MTKEQIEALRQPVICYSRPCGWYGPVQNFNLGKAAEYKDRLTYENGKD